MKKVCSETLKILINELNLPGSTSVRNFSTFWNRFGALCTQAFYSCTSGHIDKRWRKVICVVKLNFIQLQPKHKTRNFQNLYIMRKRSLREIY